MSFSLATLLAQIQALWPWEALAVLLAFGYLALAIRENAWCWPAGMASSAIYFVLMARAALYMEALLQIFYIGIAVYGWRRWVSGSAARAAIEPTKSSGAGAAPLAIRSWRVREHAAALVLVGVLSAVNGALLAAYTNAALPYLDAFTAWGSVVTTWMVARKVLENWLYWLVIDALCAYIYVQRGLWLTAGLFLAYLVMVVIGYVKWRRHMHANGP